MVPVSCGVVTRPSAEGGGFSLSCQYPLQSLSSKYTKYYFDPVVLMDVSSGVDMCRGTVPGRGGPEW